MKKILMLFLTSMFLLSACGAAVEEEGTDIEAHDAWARSALKNDNDAVYFLMHNHSGNADEIMGVSTDIAATAEIHKTEVNANSVAQMNPQVSVLLPVDAEIAFEPNGLHIMLGGLKKDLKIGDKFDITLHFKSHADIVVPVQVLDAAGPTDSGMHMDTPVP